MKKAVGIIITISMVMCSCMVAFGATTNSKYYTDTTDSDNPVTKYSTNAGEDEGDSKEVYGSYKLGGTIDKDGDGVPDTDTKEDTNSDDVDDAYTSDGDGDGKPDGDGVADKVPDYADNEDGGDNNPYNNTADKNEEYYNSSDINSPDAVAPEGATFSVDVVWGNMKYDYKVEGATWNGTSHKYEGGTQKWEGRYNASDASDLDSEAIKVTNNSNVAIRVRYKFTSELEELDGTDINLKGKFYNTTDYGDNNDTDNGTATAKDLMKLQHSVGKTPSSDVAYMKLVGDPGTAELKNSKLGTLTIKIDYTIVP